MGLTLFAAPGSEPVSVSEAKLFLRVDATTEDSLINSLITAARSLLDGRYGWLGRALITSTWELTLDAFPAWQITFPLAPVTEIVSITYLDGDGVLQTLATSAYRLDAKSEPARVTPSFNEIWPDTRCVTNAVTVRFKAGWATAAAVPDPIKTAIKLIVGALFEHREPTALEWGTVDRLLMPYRVSW